MATCALLGQAAGTAAALCVRHRCDPRSLSSGDRLAQLQAILQEDDCWLPGKTRDASTLALKGGLSGKGNLSVLLDGHDRDRESHDHAWLGSPGSALEYRWNSPVQIEGARFVFDSNLQLYKRMPCSYPHREGTCAVPKSLVKAYRIEAQDEGGDWKVVFRESENYLRLVHAPFQVRTQALRFVAEETWGDPEVRLFSFEPQEAFTGKAPNVAEGITFTELRSKADPVDLAPPEGVIDKESEKKRRRPAA